MTGPTCHGRGATEHCAKAAKYLVGKSPTCGVHMPQLVKLYLRSEPDLAVKVCLIARGGR